MIQDVCIYCGRVIYLAQLTARKSGFEEGLWYPDGWYRWCVDPNMPWWEQSYRCERSIPDLLGQNVFPKLVWHAPLSASLTNAAQSPASSTPV